MKELLAYLETLPLVGGDHDDELFKVLPWERKFIRGAFGSEGDSAITMARGNGKSGLVAALSCAVVDPDGPLHARRRHVDIFASSIEQGRIIYEDILASLGDLHDLESRKVWSKQSTVAHSWLEHKASGARVRVLGSNPKRAHGLRSWLALADEPAQWDPGKRDAMLAAIRTGLGKSPGSRLISLGTRPADDSHWFSRMLAGGAAYSQVHAAEANADIFKVSTWKRANPSWAHLPSLQKRIRQEAMDAKKDPDAMAAFKSLRLNMGVSEIVEAMLIDPATWARIEAHKPVERMGGYVLGLDLGTTAAMSAASSYWPDTGAVDVFAVFPHHPGLAERGLGDGVGGLYVKMRDRGELVLAGQYVSDLGDLLKEVVRRWGVPSAIVCDRWREGELREKLGEVEFPYVPLILRGQGFRDGAEDVRSFRSACLGGRVRPAVNLLLRSAMAEARVVIDPAGNAKMSKNSQGGRRLRARDDAASALILAVAEGDRRHDVQDSGFYLGRASEA